MSPQFKGRFLSSDAALYWNKNVRKRRQSEKDVDEIRFHAIQIVKTLLRVVQECPNKEDHMLKLHQYFNEHMEIELAEKLLAREEDI